MATSEYRHLNLEGSDHCERTPESVWSSWKVHYRYCLLGNPTQRVRSCVLGDSVTKLADFAVFGRMKTELLECLKPKSKELGEICSQFVERGIPLQIFSIYERLKIPTIQALVRIEYPSFSKARHR